MSWASFPKFLLAQSCNRWNLGSNQWWMMECCSCKDQMLFWIHFDERLMIVKTIWQKQALTLQLHGALYLGIKIIEATTTFCFVLQIFQVWFLCKGQLNYIQSAFFCHLFPMVLLSCKLLLQRNLQTFDEKARQILPHNLLKNFFLKHRFDFLKKCMNERSYSATYVKKEFRA